MVFEAYNSRNICSGKIQFYLTFGCGNLYLINEKYIRIIKLIHFNNLEIVQDRSVDRDLPFNQPWYL